ncbi:MAG TPA: MgtC/SapB family protein [Candidatus Udaeobacter sp.]|jgi:putative Mg2+ transporter-C (MgtC) family protein|nr:MgtC/SapB family protein [Candidatus Udaeobacter sp.]
MLPLHEILLRLTVAAVLGAVIGIERDLRRRPAGIRTSLFVCLATALFTILSGEIAHTLGDTGSTRIASNIVQGIGFLGAGAILRGAGSVVGMTTAAVIFVEAAIGMAVGGGFYAVAGYSAALVLFGLVVIGWAAQRFNLKRRCMVFRITTSHAENVATEVQRLLASMKIAMSQFRVSMVGVNSIVEFESDVSHSQQETILSQLNRQGVITEVIPLEVHHQ